MYNEVHFSLKSMSFFEFFSYFLKLLWKTNTLVENFVAFSTVWIYSSSSAAEALRKMSARLPSLYSRMPATAIIAPLSPQ